MASLTSYVKMNADNIATKVDKVTSTDNAIVRFDGTSGQVQNSGVIIGDDNRINGKDILELEKINKANTITNGYVKKGELVYGNTPNTFHQEASIIEVNGELYSTEGVELVPYSNQTIINVSRNGGSSNVSGFNITGLTVGKMYIVESYIEVNTTSTKAGLYADGYTYIAPQITTKGKQYLYFKALTETVSIRQLIELNIYGIASFYGISVKEVTPITLPQAPTAKVETSTTTASAYSVGEFAVLDRPELVTNGTFDSGTSGWIGVNAVVSRTSEGYLKVDDTSASGANSRAYQALNNLVIGQKYIITCNVIEGSATDTYIVASTVAYGTAYIKSAPTAGNYNLVFTADNTTMYIGFGQGGVDTNISYFDNISIKQVDEVYQAKTNTSVGALLTDTTKFTPVDSVFAGDISFYRVHKTTKALSTASFRTLGNTPKLEYQTGKYTIDEIAMQPLVDMTNNVAKNLNKVSGESDLYEDADYYYVMITSTPLLNSGGYHPVFNSLGGKNFFQLGSSTYGYWYHLNTDGFIIDSVAKCFTNSNLSTYSGVNSNTGTISSTKSGRPDGLFYNKIYDKGLGGTIPLHMMAKEPTELELELLVNDSEPKYVEYGVECVTVGDGTTDIVDYTTTNIKFINGIKTSKISIGEHIIVTDYTSNIIHRGKVYDVGTDYVSITAYQNTYVGDSTYDYNHNIVITKPSKIPTYKTSTTTDVISSPSNYPQLWKDRLAEGKSLAFNPLLVDDNGSNLIPDGTSKYIKASKKVINLFQPDIQSTDSGTSWVTTNSGIGSVGNIFWNGIVSLGSTTTRIFNYTSQNKPAVQTALPVVKPYRWTVASNSHSIYKGAMITASATDKIAVGNGSNGYESKVLENNINRIGIDIVVASVNKAFTIYPGQWLMVTWATGGQLYGDLIKYLGTTSRTDTPLSNWDYWSSSNDSWKTENNIRFVPTHSTISLDNSNSSACKWYTTINKTSDNQLVLANNCKEMVWDYDLDTIPEAVFITGTTSLSSASYPKGTILHFENTSWGALYGNTVTVTYDGSYSLSTAESLDLVFKEDGSILVGWSNGQLELFKLWDGNGFGDNNEFNNADTDLNGNSIKNKIVGEVLPYRLGAK